MEINDTISMMTSDNYKERFKAEYYQLKIRVGKLQKVIEDWDKWSNDKTVKTPLVIFERQLHEMLDYLGELALRADIEGINLKE